MRYTSGSGEVEGKVLSVTRSTECRVIIGNHFVASGRTEESARCIFPTLHACPAYQEVTLHGGATAPPLSTLLHLPSLSFFFIISRGDHGHGFRTTLRPHRRLLLFDRVWDATCALNASPSLLSCFFLHAGDGGDDPALCLAPALSISPADSILRGQIFDR